MSCTGGMKRIGLAVLCLAAGACSKKQPNWLEAELMPTDSFTHGEEFQILVPAGAVESSNNDLPKEWRDGPRSSRFIITVDRKQVILGTAIDLVDGDRKWLGEGGHLDVDEPIRGGWHVRGTREEHPPAHPVLRYATSRTWVIPDPPRMVLTCSADWYFRDDAPPVADPKIGAWLDKICLSMRFKAQ